MAGLAALAGLSGIRGRIRERAPALRAVVDRIEAG
jgi:hypothetical protein